MKNKIKKLNIAWRLIQKALKIIEREFSDNNDVNYLLWKVKKANDKLQKLIFQNIQKEYFDAEFEKIKSSFNLSK